MILNYTSKIILAGFIIALLSTGIPNLVIQDAHAAADISYTASTTTSTTITLTFSEAMDSATDSSGDWTITNPTRYVTSEAHTDGTTTMVLTLSSALGPDDTPTVKYTDSTKITDTNGGSADTLVVTNVIATDGNPVSFNSTSTCYDCIAPKLKETQITISSDNYIITTGDEPIHITANVGDKVTVTLKVADNRSTDTIPFVGLYTNFIEKSSDMGLYYTNHYDNSKNISASFYEWNIRSDDVAYDFEDTVSWSNGMPTVANDPILGEYLMVPFTFTINDHMQTSQVTAKIYDAAGNRLHVTLPVTLETEGNDPLNFDNMGKQKMLGFFNESVLSIMISELNGSEDTAPLSTLLGIPDESLPAWTLNLATWVAEDKIDSADLIIAAEYLINQ